MLKFKEHVKHAEIQKENVISASNIPMDGKNNGTEFTYKYLHVLLLLCILPTEYMHRVIQSI